MTPVVVLGKCVVFEIFQIFHIRINKSHNCIRMLFSLVCRILINGCLPEGAHISITYLLHLLFVVAFLRKDLVFTVKKRVY